MFPMPFLSIIIALVVVGVLLYLLTIIPMDATIKQVIRVLVILLVAIWIIYALFGLAGGGVGHFGSPCR